MKAHQRLIREQKEREAASENLFGAWWEEIDTSIGAAELRPVDIATATAIIEEYEWLGTMAGGTSHCFGIYWGGACAGVICFGEPTSQTMRESVCGKEYIDKVIQLQRGACVHWAHKHAASTLISYGLRQIQAAGFRIVVAFSDPDAGEVGTVYQATNWIYCGKTAKRPDYFDANGDRITGHVGKIQKWMTRRARPRKGRYVHLLGNRREKRALRAALRWPVEPYPKRDAAEVSRPDTPVHQQEGQVQSLHAAPCGGAL